MEPKKAHILRQSAALSAVLLAVLFLLPLAAVTPLQSDPPGGETPADEAENAPVPAGDRDRGTVLRVLDGESVTEMDLGSYLTGVVRAEMPASFAPEALKAQAVAARTYTLYKLLTGGNHADADVCTDPACCQAYLSEAQARSNWGRDAGANERKVREAVAATDGEAVLYGGVPILAVFHASSAGLTRPAGVVWQNDLPYLRPVSSGEIGDAIPNYYSREEFTIPEFREKVLAAWPEADLTGPPDQWLRSPDTDSAGSVITISIGGVRVKGSSLRSVLGLRSACFEWELQGDTLVFYVTGHGHGVGLSQYGANQMALEGADYRTILTHYYTGVTVEPYALAR